MALVSVRDMDLQLLRVFLKVVEYGGFSAAQAELNVTQSTISMQIAKLETRLGYRLCDRGKAGFRLTEKGQRVLDACRRLFSAIDDFRGEVQSIADRLLGDLNIGIADNLVTNPHIRLSEAIARFRSRDQDVRISLTINSPGELERMVLEKALHLGICFLSKRLPGLDYRDLFSEKQVLYCANTHPLFYRRAEELTLADIRDCDRIQHRYPLATEPTSIRDFHGSAVADNVEAIAYLVLSGNHIGYLPTHYASQWVETGLMRPLLEDELSFPVTFSLAIWKGRRQSEALKAFIEDLLLAHKRS